MPPISVPPFYKINRPTSHSFHTKGFIAILYYYLYFRRKNAPRFYTREHLYSERIEAAGKCKSFLFFITAVKHFFILPEISLMKRRGVSLEYFIYLFAISFFIASAACSPVISPSIALGEISLIRIS